MASDTRLFQACLEPGPRSLGWTIARLPFAPAEVWPHMIRLRVRGAINGFAFRSSLFPDPAGGFYLLVNRAMQAAAGARLGRQASFELAPDLDPREAELPGELAVLLDEDPSLHAWYAELSEYTRREIGKWVVSVKGEEARLRRAEQMAERLLATMEAERELPPILQIAFRTRPKARSGWAAMTPTQRRNELMAVFYYQTPESRQRRIEKLLTLAEAHQEKHNG